MKLIIRYKESPSIFDKNFKQKTIETIRENWEGQLPEVGQLSKINDFSNIKIISIQWSIDDDAYIIIGEGV